jgi:hypothetical protein
MQTWQDYLDAEREDRQRVDFKMIYVDMTGDLMAGLLLSQLVYWHLPDRSGLPKMRIQHHGAFWVAKSRHEWWDEIRMSPKQVDRAIDILVEKGLVEKCLYQFNGAPTTHLRIIPETFMARYNELKGKDLENPFLPKGEIDQGVTSISPTGENDVPQKVKSSITEITTETTAETTPPPPAKTPAPRPSKAPNGAARKARRRVAKPTKEKLSPEQEQVRNRLMHVFLEYSEAPPPTSYAQRNRVWHPPLEEIAKRCDWDGDAAAQLVKDAIAQMNKKGLEMKCPASILTVALGIKRRNGNAADGFEDAWREL